MALPQDPDKKPPKTTLIKQYGVLAPSALSAALGAAIQSQPGPRQTRYMDVPGAAGRRISGLQYQEVQSHRAAARLGGLEKYSELGYMANFQFAPHLEFVYRRYTGGFGGTVTGSNAAIKWTDDAVARIKKEVPVKLWDHFLDSESELDLNKKFAELEFDREFHLAWETYRNTDHGAFWNTHKWMKQFIQPFVDPAMLIPFGGMSAAGVKLTNKVYKAKQMKALYDLSKNAHKFAMVAPAVGIQVIADVAVASVYGKLLESEDPLRGRNDYNEYLMQSFLWSGAFGVGDGILKGAKLAKYINKARVDRMLVTDALAKEFGPDLGPILAHAVNGSAGDRRRAMEVLEKLTKNWDKARAEAVFGPALRGAGSEYAEILSEFGLYDLVRNNKEMPKSVIIRVLQALKDTDQAIRIERLLQTALLSGRTNPLRALTEEHINILRRSGREEAADIAELLVHGHLGETFNEQAQILNKLFRGQPQLLAKDEIEWLLKHRPDILAAMDLDDLHKATAAYRKNLLKELKKKSEHIARLREASIRAPKKIGQIVHDPKTGRVGRLKEITDEGKGVIEPIRDTEIDLKIAEIKKKRRALKKEKANIPERKALDNEIAELEKSRAKADSPEFETEELFTADVNTLARWEMDDVAPPSIKDMKHDTSAAKNKVTVKKKGKSRTFNVKFTATMYGRKVRIRRKTNGSLDPKKHDWEVEILGRDATIPVRVIIRPQKWWRDQIKQGNIKKEDVVYRERANLHGATQKEAFEEIQEIMYKEEVANIEKRMVDDARTALLDIFPEQDPRNILDLLSSGTVPRELRDLNIDVDTELLTAYINRTDVPSGVADDILEAAEGHTVLDGPPIHDSEALDIGNVKDKRTLNPLWNIVSMGTNWGLRMISHKIPIIAEIAQLTLGTSLALRDKFGNFVAVAGENAGLLTNGLKHTRRWLTQAKVARFVQTMTEQTNAWLLARRVTMFQKVGELQRFNRAVKRYVETGNISEELSKEAAAAVKKAGNAFAKVMRDELAWAKARKIPGFEHVKASDFYFPRYQNVAQMERIIGKANVIRLANGQEIGAKLQLRSLIKESLKKANNIDDDAAEILALRILEFYLSPRMGAPILDRVIGVQGQTIKEFVDQLDTILMGTVKEGTDEISAGFTKREREILIKKLTKGFKSDGSARTMHRIKLDMETSATFTFGKDSEEIIRVGMLFEEDVTKVAGRYVQDLITHAQIEELLRAVGPKNYRPKSIEELFSDLTSKLEEAGHSRADFKKDIDGLKNEILNIPHFDRKRLGNILQVVGQYATLLKLPGFVWAAMPEAAMAQISQGFLGGIFEQIPYFGKLISEVRGGTAKWDSIKNFVDLDIGMGRTEFDLNELYGMWNLSAQGDELFKAGSHAERGYLGLKRGTVKFTRWSAFRAQQMYSDRVATRNFFNLLVRASKGNKNILKMFSDVRLAQIGWSRKDLDSILATLRKEGVVTTESAGRGNVFTINTEAMDSISRAKFKSGASENLRQTVQRSSKSDLPYVFIESDIGSILTQFRSFALTSQVNHLGRNLQAHDMMALQQVSTMFLSGAALYTFQTYARFWDDKPRLRAEMTMAKIAGGALLYSGFMGIIPDIIDAGLVLGGRLLDKDIDPFFAPGGGQRLMGLRVPALDVIQSTYGGVQGLLSIPIEGKLTQRNYQKLRMAAPGANMWYLKVLLDIFRDSVPKI